MHHVPVRGRIGSLILVLAVAALPLAAQNAAEIAKGKQLFLGMCSRCHGVEGGGGEGPNLNRAVLTHANTDDELAAVIRNGIPDRGMPRIRRFTDAELHALMVFVKSLGATGGLASSGNAENGKAVYRRLGCAGCHIVGGEGGGLGPELTNIGVSRSPDYLRVSIVDPAASLPKGTKVIPGRGFNEFLPVRVVTAQGQEVRGVRLNEDSFTIQIRDARGQLHSFRKADLKTLDKQMGKSLMPEFKDRVAGSDLNDLVAYLSSLGGAK